LMVRVPRGLVLTGEERGRELANAFRLD
jgi:hypothetical protein